MDEAHHLRNRTTAAWKFASELQKQFILLLTATPVQNNLEELFNLVTLLEPGLLSTQRDFSRRFRFQGGQTHAEECGRTARPAERSDGPQPPEHRRPAIHAAIRPHRIGRADARRTGVSTTPLAALVRSGLNAPTTRRRACNRMTLIMLQMALGSSAAAAAAMLDNLLDKPICRAEQRAALPELSEQASRARQQRQGRSRCCSC